MSNMLLYHRLKAGKRLVRLFDAEEKARFCELLSNEPNIDKLKLTTDKLIVREFKKCSFFKVFQLASNVLEPTAIMLEDIIDFLERHGVSARTTGFILALDNSTEVTLSTQEVNQVCSFSSKTLRKISNKTFQQIYNDWHSLKLSWRKILSQSKHRTVWKENYNTKTYKLENKTNCKAQQLLKCLISRSKELKNILNRISEAEHSQIIDNFLADIDKQLGLCNEVNFSCPKLSKPCEKIDKQTMHKHKYLIDTLKQIKEDLCTIADLTESEKFFDILCLDLWSTRPQLYEVWLLTKILGWLEECQGYQVSLLETKCNEHDRVVWHLYYAKASLPCAKISHNEKNWFMYFQLYQKKSKDMPDFCILTDLFPTGKPLVALDAKHSEKGSYTLNSYKNTAMRYRDSFGASLSLAIEYFPRTDLSQDNLIEFNEGVSLVKDARPKGKGLKVVFELLSEKFPVIISTIICIDYSSSFNSRRNQVFHETLNNLKEEINDTYVCFAETAIAKQGMKLLLNTIELNEIPESQLKDGTSLLPLIEKLKEINKFNQVILISDGEFSEKNWLECIENECNCRVKLYS